jgi:hypothetical protein
MKKLIVLFFCLFQLSIKAQPGYRGGNNLVSAGFNTGWGMYRNQSAVIASPVISFERVLSRKKSIAFFATASAGRMKLPEQWGYFDGPETGDYYSYYGGSYWIKPLNQLYYGMTGLGVEIKRYVMNSGGLAPFGTYYSYGFNTQFWTLKNSVNLRLGQSTFDGSQPEFYYYTQTLGLQKLQSVNFHFTYGKKRFVNNHLFIDYGLTIGITGLWTNLANWGTYQYSNQDIQSLDDIANLSFMTLMNRTHRIQFNLKGGWLL